MKDFIIRTDGNVDVKDCKRAMIDYMKDNDIEFKYCHAWED